MTKVINEKDIKYTVYIYKKKEVKALCSEERLIDMTVNHSLLITERRTAYWHDWDSQ